MALQTSHSLLFLVIDLKRNKDDKEPLIKMRFTLVSLLAAALASTTLASPTRTFISITNEVTVVY